MHDSKNAQNAYLLQTPASIQTRTNRFSCDRSIDDTPFLSAFERWVPQAQQLRHAAAEVSGITDFAFAEVEPERPQVQELSRAAAEFCDVADLAPGPSLSGGRGSTLKPSVPVHYS